MNNIQINTLEQIDTIDFSQENDIYIDTELDNETLFNIVLKINTLEYSTKSNSKICFQNIDVKKMIYIYKKLLQSDIISTLYDSNLILNIFMLLKTYNTFNNEYFNHKYIYVNNITDVLDLKIELKSEIQYVSTEIARYFMSLFRSINKFEYTFLDNHIELSTFYSRIFSTFDLNSISLILLNINKIDNIELVYIKNSHFYLDKMLNSYTMSNTLLHKFIEKYEL